MWDYVKDCLYRCADLHELKHRIAAAIHSIAPQILANIGLKSSIAWTYNTQPRDLTSAFINFYGAVISFGIADPIGHQDFYPNGGSGQPQCVKNQNSEEAIEDGNLDGPVSVDVNVCDHSSASLFFMQSVNPAECVFLSAMCDSYEDFQEGDCSNNSNALLTKMGLPAQPILGLGPMTEFYLRTGPNPPYCLEDGYEPE
ncbi:hypothetical protein AVEN_235728-1 [Araneus ventricosus]|uniref:Lipase domain-containing protein n=1 Tax=Araneus ventricosus TaxID=182803 RepID=A0A4Y2HMP3_ARAVE|nr:hypothetical protein AVEN_235728-1 [Araneus ventricosus]